MNIKKILLALSCTLMLACGKTEETKTTETNGDTTYKVGITQIVTHPSLDLVREGFKKSFEEAGIKAEFDETNAEGAIANANLIANNFAADKKDIILGIATPSAQALANTITDIPILFSAVTDPEEAKILNPNVTGTSDKLDNVGQQLDLLKALRPEVKKIGIVYNTSEANSLVQLKEVEDKAKERGIEVQLQGVTSISELPQATSLLLADTDAIYVTTDNLVVAGIQVVNAEAKKQNKPVVTSEKSSVDQGALFTIGLDYFELGKRTGEMAIEILLGNKKPADIPFETTNSTNLYLNETTAKELGIDLSNPLLKDAILVK